MNKTLLLIFSFLIITSTISPQSKIDINNLIDFDGLLYAPNSDKPYSGIIFDLYENSANKKLDGYYRNGLKNGNGHGGTRKVSKIVQVFLKTA